MIATNKVRPSSATPEYWRSLFSATFAPFIFFSPYFILAGKNPFPKCILLEEPELLAYQRLRRIWAKVLTKASCLIVVGSIASIIVAAAGTGYIGYRIGIILFQLLVHGALAATIVNDGYDIILAIPIIYFNYYLWFRGYEIKYTIESFDDGTLDAERESSVFWASETKSAELNEVKGEVGVEVNKDGGEKTETEDTDENPPPPYDLLLDEKPRHLMAYKSKLILFYITMLTAQGICAALTTEHYVKKKNIWKLKEDLVDLVAGLVYLFSLALYLSFCYGLQSQVTSLALYMDFFRKHHFKLTEHHLLQIRTSFKSLAVNAVHINHLCRVFMSMVLGILFLIFAGEGYDFLVNRVGVPLLTDYMRSITSLFDSSASSGGSSATRAPATDLSKDYQFEVYLVRVALAELLYLILVTGLMFWTVYEAYMTNLEIRYLQVKYNDFAIGQSQDSMAIDSETSSGVRMVKSYMLSRIEEFQHNRAQLEIPIVASLPIVGKFLTKQTVWN